LIPARSRESLPLRKQMAEMLTSCLAKPGSRNGPGRGS
jgi:hypothetical protein